MPRPHPPSVRTAQLHRGGIGRTHLPRALRGLAALPLLALLAACTAATPPPSTTAEAVPAAEVELLGEVRVPTGTRFGDTEIGGLSGLARLPDGRYLAVSDDKADHGPGRFYTVEVDLADGTLEPGDVTFLAVTALRGPGGELLPSAGLDPEGIAAAPDGSVWVSSEGWVERGKPPWIRRFAPDGTQIEELPLPARLLPGPDGTGTGVRNNLALESLTLTPDGRRLVTATENALVQDGPAAPEAGGGRSPGPVRILFRDVAGERWVREVVYPIDPPHARALLPAGPGSFRAQGLVDLLAETEERFLALERSFVAGSGNRVRLYRVDVASADDVSDVDSLAEGEAPPGLRTATKTLLADLGELALPSGERIRVDNLEGIAWGPRLADGRRTLLLVSDNNFREAQVTQFVALALGD